MNLLALLRITFFANKVDTLQERKVPFCTVAKGHIHFERFLHPQQLMSEIHNPYH